MARGKYMTEKKNQTCQRYYTLKARHQHRDKTRIEEISLESPRTHPRAGNRRLSLSPMHRLLAGLLFNRHSSAACQSWPKLTKSPWLDCHSQILVLLLHLGRLRRFLCGVVPLVIVAGIPFLPALPAIPVRRQSWSSQQRNRVPELQKPAGDRIAGRSKAKTHP
jgi:hypothetical protein